MSFGQHKGKLLSAIPTDYLDWLLSLDHLRDPPLSAVQAEIERREAKEAEHAARAINVDPQVADELVSVGLHVLTRRHHPDAPNGSNDRMREINLAAAWLRARVRDLCA